MTERNLSLRFVAVCGTLLLLLFVLALAGGEDTQVLMDALEIAPLAFAGTFLFNQCMAANSGKKRREESLGKVAAGTEMRTSTAVFLLMLALGLSCAAVAAFTPKYLPALVWIAPVLAGSAGIHLAAIHTWPAR
jgi:hypothetical protein